MRIAVVIPCYQVAAHLGEVVRTIPPDIEWIIAVDDCSTDGTAKTLVALSAAEPRLITLRHDVNQGVGGAMITGYRKAMDLGADIVVKMDGDGQMDPADIHALVQPILRGTADFAKGNRFRDLNALGRMPLARRIGNLGLSFLIKAASGYWNIFDPTNGYTAIRHETLRELPIEKLDKRYFFESSVLIQLYHQQAVVEDVPMRARYGNEVSGLSITRTLIEFPPKLLIAFLKRIVLRYFLFDFNIASLYFLFGGILFLTGAIYGISEFIRFQHLGAAAPTGTVVIPTLLITLGFQLLLAAVNFDITNTPKR
jgi:glycosyltransferase involved in cell wall biosynthesis